ncbi:MAG: DGQHR domain-containing protein, partial [Xanthobacteraceae bacterium]
IPSKQLFEIAYFDIRHIFHQDGDGIDSYLGIQRVLSKKRVAEIHEYAVGKDATFPTAIVLAVPEQCAELTPTPDDQDRFFNLKLKNHPNAENPQDVILYRQIARVIDGQHRIAGLENYYGPTFELNVSIFIGADISDQASIFATVNLAQTKVNKSLVYDLYELSKTRSPEKTCHQVAVALDRTEGSPFHKKIKRLGTATKGRIGETLSQATVVNGILQYISRDRIQLLQDREIGKRGAKWPRVDAETAKRLILRPFFVEERDTDIANLIWNYFAAVSERWPMAWNSGGEGLILNKTNGYNALMRFFRIAYLNFADPGQMVDKEKFGELFSRVTMDDNGFDRTQFLPGSTGATELYSLFVMETGLPG